MTEALVETLAVSLAKAKAASLGDTLSDVEVKEVVDSLGDTPAKAEEETHPAM